MIAVENLIFNQNVFNAIGSVEILTPSAQFHLSWRTTVLISLD